MNCNTKLIPLVSVATKRPNLFRSLNLTGETPAGMVDDIGVIVFRPLRDSALAAAAAARRGGGN